MRPFHDPAVAAKFEAYPPAVRRKLLALREVVYRTAASTPGVSEIVETLKWGEPAYVTKAKTGSTFRMDWKSKDPGHYRMYFHCQTNLVETFRTLFPNDFQFEGNRALVFSMSEQVPADELSVCMALALTYHLAKASHSRGRKHV